MRQGNDRTAKWLVEHHGDAILRIGGIDGFTAWKALASETVAPRRLPDGLIEVWFPDEKQSALVLVEIETYPGGDVDRQVFEDLAAIYLSRGVMAEVVCLVLKPKGNLTVSGTATRRSRQGTTTFTARWPVVNLWDVDADELLAGNDPGLIPWVPLARSTRPRDELLLACRDRLNAVPNRAERSTLLAVTAILAGLAHDPKGLLTLFGGVENMIESPVLDELMEFAREKERVKVQAETRLSTTRVTLLAFLEARFGAVPADVQAALAGVTDLARLDALVRTAATCPDLAAFAAALA